MRRLITAAQLTILKCFCLFCLFLYMYIYFPNWVWSSWGMGIPGRYGFFQYTNLLTQTQTHVKPVGLPIPVSIIKRGILKWIWSSFYTYVDDLLLLGEDLFKIEDIKCQLGKLYQMKDLGPASFYLGICITRDWNTWAIWINQQAYIEVALKRFKLLDANSPNTPLPAGIHLEKSKEPVSLNTKTYY